MSEQPRNLEFHHVPYGRQDFEYEPTGGLADMFKNADYLKPEIIKNYIQQIVEQVNQSQDSTAQKACVIDLLREENIQKLLAQKEIDADDKEEIEKMTLYWVKKIKKGIIEELKKYLPDDLYFFVKEKEKQDYHLFNKKSIIIDSKTDREYFFKESRMFSNETREEMEECFRILRNAINNLKNPEKEMPFIIKPENIGQNTKDGHVDNQSISLTSNQVDLTSIEDALGEEAHGNMYYKELDEASAKKALSGILDCLRGTRFLAQNGLTLTDLDTEPIGKNLGINNKNKRGVLFDLDGLQQIGHNINRIIAPSKANGEKELRLFAPEYRLFGIEVNTVATAESMIWEIGDSILGLAEIQIDILFKSSDFFAKNKLISVWEKLREFSNKMIAKKPTDRPSFDICITKIEEIINKLPDQQ